MRHVSVWIIPKFQYSKLLWHNSLVDKKPSGKGERNGYTLKNKTMLLVSLVLEHLLFQKSSCIYTRYVLIFANGSTFTVNGRDWKEYISIEAIGNECRCVCSATKCVINWLNLDHNLCKMKGQVKCYTWGVHDWDGERSIQMSLSTHTIRF